MRLLHLNRLSGIQAQLHVLDVLATGADQPVDRLVYLRPEETDLNALLEFQAPL